MIAPIIDEISSEYKDKLKCVKLNTDESPQVATDYGIRSIPTVSPPVTFGSDEQVCMNESVSWTHSCNLLQVMIFKNGKKMDTIIGAVPKSTLVQAVEK
jgi:thioredoxin 1